MSDSDVVDYYSTYAKSYDNIYQDFVCDADYVLLCEQIGSMFDSRSVIEVACGTGHWTRLIAEKATNVVASDISWEMLSRASKKTSASNIIYLQADAYDTAWATSGRFSGGFAGYWLSHVPVSRCRNFIDEFHRLLSPSAQVCLFDNVQTADYPVDSQDEQGNTYQERHIGDTDYTVLKNFYSEEELVEMVSHQASDIQYHEFEYHWLLQYKYSPE